MGKNWSAAKIWPAHHLLRMQFHCETSQAENKSTEQFLNFQMQVSNAKPVAANMHLSVRMTLTTDIDLQCQLKQSRNHIYLMLRPGHLDSEAA
jgi:hypothetical protein